MASTDALASLRGIPLFSRVAQADLEQIASHLIERRYPLPRSLAIATPLELRATTADFVTFVSSVDDQQILARHGYAPATVPIRIVRTVEEGE